MFIIAKEKINSKDVQNNLWTLLSSGAASLNAAVMFFITVRTIGLDEAGFLSFAMAVASLFQIIAMFGIRHYQSTDIKQEHSFNSYLGLRFCSVLLASMSVAVYLFIVGNNMTRTLIIVLAYLYYLADAIADVFMGDLQQKSLMRVAGRMRVCAYASCILVFSATSIITQSLITSLAVMCITIYMNYIIWIWIYRKNFKGVRAKFDVRAIKTLTYNIWPFIIGSFTFSFVVSTPKYFLESLWTDETVAMYSIFLLPVTLLALLSNSFFSGAEITKSAEIFSAGSAKALSQRLNKQILLALCFSAAMFLCLFTFGIPLFSWMYGTDLSPYSREYLIMGFGGVMVSVKAALGACMTVLRKQRTSLLINVTVSLVTVPVTWFVISRLGVLGAVFSNLIFFAPLAIVTYIVCRSTLKKMI